MPKFSFGRIFAKLGRKSSPATHTVGVDVRLNIPLLPQEILLYIASFANEDEEILKAMSQTSRDWHSVSITFIFRSVAIGSRKRMRLFDEILLSDPQVASAVRLLSIQSGFSPDLEAILETVRGLPNLTSLVMHNSFGVGSHYLTLDILDLLATLSTITHLDLIGSFHPSVAVDLAASLPNLSHFTMADSSFPNYIRDYSQNAHRLETLRLTTLRLDWFDSMTVPIQGILSQLLASPCRESLKSVSLSVFREHLQSVGHFLHEMSPTLEHLELKLVKIMAPADSDSVSRHRRWDMAAFRRELDLSHMVALHSFALHYVLRRDPEDLEDLLSIFSMLPYQQIRKLTIHLYLDFPCNIPECLSLLVTQISNERFKSLEEIEYVYSGPLHISHVSAILEELLPSFLHANRVMKVTCACVGKCVWHTDGFHRKKYL